MVNKVSVVANTNYLRKIICLLEDNKKMTIRDLYYNTCMGNKRATLDGLAFLMGLKVVEIIKNQEHVKYYTLTKNYFKNKVKIKNE